MVLLAALAHTAAFADDALRLDNPRIRLLPGDLPLAGYFTLVNPGERPAVLTKAESSGFERITMHRTVRKGDLVRMQHVSAVSAAPGGSIVFAPGAYHLMLMKRRTALHVGDRVSITLRFEDGRRLTADFEVRLPGVD